MNQILEPTSPVTLIYLEASKEEKNKKDVVEENVEKNEKIWRKKTKAKGIMRKIKSRHSISRKGVENNKVSTFNETIQSGSNFI